MAGSIKKESVHYRERNGIILPYIKYKMVDRNCRSLHEMPIDKIVVGPGLNQEKTVESVKYFLEKVEWKGYLKKN